MGSSWPSWWVFSRRVRATSRALESCIVAAHSSVVDVPRASMSTHANNRAHTGSC